ncbi:MAG: cell division protein SepF [Nanoarchaeota archaeon]
MVFGLKGVFNKSQSSDDYIELDLNQTKARKEKIKIRQFTLKKYDDINEILASLREGYTIAFIDIKQLKSKDIIELKRALTKIKKTVDAMEGSIAGFGDNAIIVSPEFAEIYRGPSVQAGAQNVPKDDMLV